MEFALIAFRIILNSQSPSSQYQHLDSCVFSLFSISRQKRYNTMSTPRFLLWTWFPLPLLEAGIPGSHRDSEGSDFAWDKEESSYEGYPSPPAKLQLHHQNTRNFSRAETQLGFALSHIPTWGKRYNSYSKLHLWGKQKHLLCEMAASCWYPSGAGSSGFPHETCPGHQMSSLPKKCSQDYTLLV